MMPRSPSHPFLAAYFSLAAVMGCGADVTVASGATGTGGMSGASGGGAAGGTGGGGGMAGGSGVSCRQCACETPMSAGGCEDICTMGVNGLTPNFCDGVPALSMCAACLLTTCPTADPNDPCTCCLNADPNNCSCF